MDHVADLMSELRLFSDSDLPLFTDCVENALAVSRLKCNVFEVVVPVCHEVEVGQEDFCWAFPSE